MFLFPQWHECHSAIAGMIRNHFGMHCARVFLFLLGLVLLMMGITGRPIEVNCSYLSDDANSDRHCADESKKLFLHFHLRFL